MRTCLLTLAMWCCGVSFTTAQPPLSPSLALRIFPKGIPDGCLSPDYETITFITDSGSKVVIEAQSPEYSQAVQQYRAAVNRRYSAWFESLQARWVEGIGGKIESRPFSGLMLSWLKPENAEILTKYQRVLELATPSWKPIPDLAAAPRFRFPRLSAKQVQLATQGVLDEYNNLWFPDSKPAPTQPQPHWLFTGYFH